jgi:hypothetical protein
MIAVCSLVCWARRERHAVYSLVLIGARSVTNPQGAESNGTKFIANWLPLPRWNPDRDERIGLKTLV